MPPKSAVRGPSLNFFFGNFAGLCKEGWIWWKSPREGNFKVNYLILCYYIGTSKFHATLNNNYYSLSFIIFQNIPLFQRLFEGGGQDKHHACMSSGA